MRQNRYNYMLTKYTAPRTAPQHSTAQHSTAQHTLHARTRQPTQAQGAGAVTPAPRLRCQVDVASAVLSARNALVAVIAPVRVVASNDDSSGARVRKELRGVVSTMCVCVCVCVAHPKALDGLRVLL